MEMSGRLLFVLVSLLFSSHAAAQLDMRKILDVYVDDFHSDEPDRCRPSDVNLSHREAREFFLRSKQVSAKVLHDHYDYAPCYVEGTLKYRAMSCTWQIRAGATARITCGKRTWHFACDACDDLLRPREVR